MSALDRIGWNQAYLEHLATADCDCGPWWDGWDECEEGQRILHPEQFHAGSGERLRMHGPLTESQARSNRLMQAAYAPLLDQLLRTPLTFDSDTTKVALFTRVDDLDD